MKSTLDFIGSTLASGLRGWQGINARAPDHRPEQILELYDIENCPFCRIVREVLTQLDLDAVIYPCPKGGERYRRALKEQTGKAQFPYLVDPAAGVEMFESVDIIRYLFERYGGGTVPLQWQLAPLQKFSSGLASAVRGGKGMHAMPSNPPETLLELYSFEASPFARPVRELLCQMEIPYVLRSSGRSTVGEWLPPKLREHLQIAPGSTLHNRVALMQKEGKQGIPYLWDPNSSVGLFESEAILMYLRDSYGR